MRRAPGALGGRRPARIEVVELVPDVAGDAIEVVFDGRERTVVVDGFPTLSGVPALEAIGARVGARTWSPPRGSTVDDLGGRRASL